MVTTLDVRARRAAGAGRERGAGPRAARARSGGGDDDPARRRAARARTIRRTPRRGCRWWRTGPGRDGGARRCSTASTTARAGATAGRPRRRRSSGRWSAPPGAAPATLIDRADTIEVDLARADMVLGDADDAALDRGAQPGAGRRRIAPVRPRRADRRRALAAVASCGAGGAGPSTRSAAQAVGDRFVLLTPDAVAAIDLPVAAIGSSVRVLASGIGDSRRPGRGGVRGRSARRCARPARSSCGWPRSTARRP